MKRGVYATSMFYRQSAPLFRIPNSALRIPNYAPTPFPLFAPVHCPTLKLALCSKTCLRFLREPPFHRTIQRRPAAMNPPENLVQKITQKTDDELLAMFESPDDWLPEALDSARAELHRRNIPTERIAEADSAVESPGPEPFDDAPPPDEEQERPAIITALCLVGFIGAPLGLVGTAMLTYSFDWIFGYAVCFTVARIVCMIGYWKMKRWGVTAYLILGLAHEWFLIHVGAWSLRVLFWQASVYTIGYWYLPRMR